MPKSDDALLELAKGYPYFAPGQSYLYCDGGYVPLKDAIPDDAARARRFVGRVAVIGHGSNRSPAQLKRKFDYLSGARSEIPVTRAWLRDHDVVYSAHITQYGAVAANLQHMPGVAVEVYVTWLTVEQLERMHATELGGRNYYYGRMDAIHLELEAGPTAVLDTVQVYISTHGCLALDGKPVGLAAVGALGRPYGTLSQHQALALVRDRHRPGREMDAHILETIRAIEQRKAIVAEIRQSAVPQSAPHFTVLEAPPGAAKPSFR